MTSAVNNDFVLSDSVATIEAAGNWEQTGECRGFPAPKKREYGHIYCNHPGRKGWTRWRHDFSGVEPPCSTMYMSVAAAITVIACYAHLYYKRRSLYLCSAKAPVLDGSGSRR